MITLLLELVLKIASWLLAAPPSPVPVHSPSGACEIPRVLPPPQFIPYLFPYYPCHIILRKNVLQGLLVCAKLTGGPGSALAIAFVAGEGFRGAP